jgi:hypothetical protein
MQRRQQWPTRGGVRCAFRAAFRRARARPHVVTRHTTLSETELGPARSRVGCGPRSVGLRPAVGWAAARSRVGCGPRSVGLRPAAGWAAARGRFGTLGPGRRPAQCGQSLRDRRHELWPSPTRASGSHCHGAPASRGAARLGAASGAGDSPGHSDLVLGPGPPPPGRLVPVAWLGGKLGPGGSSRMIKFGPAARSGRPGQSLLVCSRLPSPSVAPGPGSQAQCPV